MSLAVNKIKLEIDRVRCHLEEWEGARVVEGGCGSGCEGEQVTVNSTFCVQENPAHMGASRSWRRRSTWILWSSRRLGHCRQSLWQ